MLPVALRVAAHPRMQPPCRLASWLLCIYCPYYSISRTILPRHTGAPIEESAYHFWSKTGKNGRTYRALV